MGDSLTDVLQALKKHENIMNNDPDYADESYNIHMDMDGSFWDDGGHMFTWDLKYTFLSEQTQDVQKAIINILK